MENIWTEVKTAIRGLIPNHSYKMWIEPVEFDDYDTNRVVLSCPNFFSVKRVKDNYYDIIESEFKKATGSTLRLHFDVSGKKPSPELKNGDEPAIVKSPYEVDTKPLQMDLPSVKPHARRLISGRKLRKRYTFDSFVVGGNNDFAYSAALSLASGSLAANNSLFLFSGTGMGKSHLSQAIGHHILDEMPSERVYYITAEDFTNEMVSSFRQNSIDNFKEKYRTQCDVLLLEDVHFLTGKERTQQELAQTLDYLFESDKKIIFSSCYLPAEIPKLNDQLKSRLSSGLVSTIDVPDFKTRVKIIKKKSFDSGCLLPDDVSDYLASELTDNVRQLESGLIGVTAKSSLLGMPIDLNLAESVVKNISNERKTVTIDVIKKLVSSQYNISVAELVSKSRRQAVVRPRQVAIYLSRKYTDQPLQAIGKSFNRYHATAIHAIGSVEKSIREKGVISKHLEYLSRKLEEGDF